ncbi:chromosomal protein MC1 domain-containing protein [Megavirus chiliensis]|uniref:Uncharacterized protein n=5 Tax=Megamimivirinae TaxID=3044648 RepID=A0A2L2DMC4_MIMIV|nr:hypothetical protein MegaChil _gp0478 [Megavirus chiliensis]AEQ33136.1 chromosomal protein MC1 domain-containing protein [Megavirus chiliensis]AGD92396.1 hypothetical protein LBA_00478 [Megavirus lba]AUV58425.1 hypothetical protein [Bandra megavirus]AVG47315.1 hypothetical protein [Acanthamoeba polyphaga mimivirus]
MGMRNFTLIDPITNKSNGKYFGHTPKQAATKAYSQFVRKLEKENKPIPQTSIIILQEYKSNGLVKNHKYEASRKNYIEPIKIFISYKVITFYHYNVLRKIKSSKNNNKTIEDKIESINLKLFNYENNIFVPQIQEIII